MIVIVCTMFHYRFYYFVFTPIRIYIFPLIFFIASDSYIIFFRISYIFNSFRCCCFRFNSYFFCFFKFFICRILNLIPIYAIYFFPFYLYAIFTLMQYLVKLYFLFLFYLVLVFQYKISWYQDNYSKHYYN